MEIVKPPARLMRWEPIHATLVLALLVHVVLVLAWLALTPRRGAEDLRVVAQVDVVDRMTQPKVEKLPEVRIPQAPRLVAPRQQTVLGGTGARVGKAGRAGDSAAPAPRAINLDTRYPTTPRRAVDRRSPVLSETNQGGSAKGNPLGDPDGTEGGRGQGGTGTGGTGTSGPGEGGEGGEGGTGGGGVPLVTRPHHWGWFPDDDQPRILNTGEANMPAEEFHGLGHAKVWVEMTVPGNSGTPSNPKDVKILQVEVEGASDLGSDLRQKKLAGLGYILATTSVWTPGTRAGQPADHVIRLYIEINPPAGN